MTWGLMLFAAYLLGTAAAAALLHGPIRRLTGTDTTPEHADRSTKREADMIVALIVLGTAALWPLTLLLYLAAQFVPASDMADDDSTETAIEPMLHETAARD